MENALVALSLFERSPVSALQDEGIQRRREQAQRYCRRRIELFKEEANGLRSWLLEKLWVKEPGT